MKCKHCDNQAIYDKHVFCKEHFISYYLKKVDKVAKYLKGKKVLIAVSGGKDSLATAHSLISFPHIKKDLFYINLGIDDYSNEGEEICRRFSQITNIPLIVYRLKEKNRFGVPQLKDYADRFTREKVCAVCGLVKRYILNRYAFENDYDFIITGHNLDDELSFLIQSIQSQDVDQILRTGKITKSIKDKKLVGRAKPLYFISEKENRLYCMLNNIQYYHDICPFSTENIQLKIKEIMNDIELKLPNFKLNTLKTIMKMKTTSYKNNIDVVLCGKCGYPTSTNICKFCRVVDKMEIKNDN